MKRKVANITSIVKNDFVKTVAKHQNLLIISFRLFRYTYQLRSRKEYRDSAG